MPYSGLAHALLLMLVSACANQSANMNRAEPDQVIPAQSASETADDHDEQVREFLAEIGACMPDPVQEWRGRRFTPGAEATLLEKTGAAYLRLVRPGEAVSMDYQTDRLTVELDEAGVILTLRCG